VNSASMAFAAFVRDMVGRGGPKFTEHEELTTWIRLFDSAKHQGLVTAADEMEVFAAFGDAFSLDTVQGFAFRKPYGYSGDFEMIDRIYTSWMSSRPDLIAWDQYFHAQAAPAAVRNRKAYFHRLLDELVDRLTDARVLNLGSGPGRGICEWFERNPNAVIKVDCIERDQRAIEYARNLNKPYLERITFLHQDVFKTRPDHKYDLIWAAGLFDYFRDRTFVLVAKRMLASLATGGEMVIGNFSVGNPTQAYMELGRWCLNHRTEAQLRDLIMAAGVESRALRVAAETEGVNLFAHGSRP